MAGSIVTLLQNFSVMAALYYLCLILLLAAEGTYYITINSAIFH